MKYRMFDTHCHCLYGMDDGSQSLEMSLEMLKMAREQGVTDVVCSSHSWGKLEDYEENFSTLQSVVVENNIPINLYKGNELACAEDRVVNLTERLENGSLYTIAGTNYILIEFLPWITTSEVLYVVKELQKARLKASGNATKIIIAHVERYFEFHNDENIINQLEDLGCLLQINVYSLVKESDEGIKAYARKMLKEEKVSFTGSDAHCSNHRPPDVIDGLKYIYDNCSKEYADRVCSQNAERYFK